MKLDEKKKKSEQIKLEEIGLVAGRLREIKWKEYTGEVKQCQTMEGFHSLNLPRLGVEFKTVILK
jgi:hypothetical protein